MRDRSRLVGLCAGLLAGAIVGCADAREATGTASAGTMDAGFDGRDVPEGDTEAGLEAAGGDAGDASCSVALPASSCPRFGFAFWPGPCTGDCSALCPCVGTLPDTWCTMRSARSDRCIVGMDCQAVCGAPDGELFDCAASWVYCGAGQSCDAGFCVDDECASGGPGARCTRDAECLAGHCVAGACSDGSYKSACYTGAQCQSGTCSTGSEPFTCEVGYCLGALEGQPCDKPGDCLAGFCGAGRCTAGEVGAPCTADSQCAHAMCTNANAPDTIGVCTAGQLGDTCSADAQCDSRICVLPAPCLPGDCTGGAGVCASGELGAVCSADKNCHSGACPDVALGKLGSCAAPDASAADATSMGDSDAGGGD
jgi:hypothetical protein